MASRSRRVIAPDGDLSWHVRAECRPENGHDPTLWHPDEPIEWRTRAEMRHARRIRAEMTAKAKAICMTCTVRAECLGYADATDETEGIWGGKTPQERGKTPLR